jgi:hypothetical protein
MIATVVMTWDWIELPINLGIDREKMLDRIQANDKILDGFWAIYNSLCLTAWEDNAGPILVSDYTEENQTNDWNVADYIELNPKGELVLPWSKQVQALNRPMVMWQEWDVLKVIAR